MRDLFEKYLRKDWKLKLLSLVLAMALWYTVSEIGEPTKDIAVNLSFANLAKELIVTKTDAPRVTLTVSGRVSLLKDLTENDVRVSVNLAGAKEGETVFSVVKTNVSIPKGLQVEAIKPGTVKVTIDRVMEKRLKTVVKLDKGLASGYGIVSWFPHHVTAEGPEKILEGMSVIETTVVYGNFRSNEEVVEAGLNMDGLQLVKVKPETVKIVLRKQNGKGAFWD